MPRAFTPKALTANALLEGDVIYFAPDNTWVRSLCDARVFTDQETAEAALAEAGTDGRIVGAYLADVTPHETGPKPAHFREDFRRKGPSNYPHGKQEAL